MIIAIPVQLYNPGDLSQPLKVLFKLVRYLDLDIGDSIASNIILQCLRAPIVDKIFRRNVSGRQRVTESDRVPDVNLVCRFRWQPFCR